MCPVRHSHSDVIDVTEILVVFGKAYLSVSAGHKKLLQLEIHGPYWERRICFGTRYFPTTID